MLRLFFVYREKELNEIQISDETYHIEVLEDEIKSTRERVQNLIEQLKKHNK